jgi:hypothetical protein
MNILIDKCRTKLIREINRCLQLRLTSSPYLSGDSFRTLANHVFDTERDFNRSRSISYGDVIFCATHLFSDFRFKILPYICHPFILITHNSDASITPLESDILANPYLLHWFAQNNQVVHDKITSIPIGLENRWMHNHGRLSKFKKNNKSNHIKNPQILCAFNTHTNPVVRERAKAILQAHPMATFKQVAHKEYLEVLSNNMFVASPAGNGFDCHRTWEALYVETIPIVVGRKFYSSFPLFPGLVLDQWENLRDFSTQYLVAQYAEKLKLLQQNASMWFPYWEQKIYDFRNNQ